MNRIKVEIDNKGTEYTVPDRYDELTREQLLAVCAALGGRMSEPAFYSAMTGIPEETWQEIPFGKRYFLMRLFDFAFEKEPKFSRQLLPWIEADGVRLIGYQPSFSNTSWEEFIYADGYMLAGRHREAAAVLYRPQREDYNGETDRRGVSSAGEAVGGNGAQRREAQHPAVHQGQEGHLHNQEERQGGAQAPQQHTIQDRA